MYVIYNICCYAPQYIELSQTAKNGPQDIRKLNSLALRKNMFCIYITETAAKQELKRSRGLKVSLQQEQELGPKSSIFQEQDWIRS